MELSHTNKTKKHGNPLGDSRFIVLLIAIALSALMFTIPEAERYAVLDTSTRRYVRCTVTDAEFTGTQDVSKYSGRTLGTQIVTVEIDGETVEIENGLSDTHHIEVKPGDRVVVCVDEPENTEPYYTIANYDRTGVEIAICVFFAFILILTGGMRGADELAALVFSVIFLFKITIPAIYAGYLVLAVTAAAVLIITPVSIFLISGVNKKSAVSTVAVFVGEAAAAAIFSIFLGRPAHKRVRGRKHRRPAPGHARDRHGSVAPALRGGYDLIAGSRHGRRRIAGRGFVRDTR